MSRVCTVCTHPKRKQLDRLLVGKKTAHCALSREFGVGRDALRRHANAHVSAAIVRSVDAQEAVRGDDLFAQAREQQARATKLYHTAESLLLRAQRKPDLDLGLKAVRAVARVLDETGSAIELWAKVNLAASETLSRAEAQLLLDQIEDVIRRHVLDREALGAIARELHQLSPARTVTAVDVS